MIIYKNCMDSTMSEVFEAFSLGFSDYIVKFTMDQDTFATHFFGPEGNALGLSFIAFDRNRPIGLILGGIRLFDGLKTMRCGTLCISPSYRGQGISNELFEMHKSAALTAQCKQLYLEVIKDNYRAVKFYEKLGYYQVYTMKYFSKLVQPNTFSTANLPYEFKEISFAEIEACRKALYGCHINWQSDSPFYADSKDAVFLGAYDVDKQIALIAMSSKGKINFLWVDPAYRNQGLGSMMYQKAAVKQNVEKVTICLPDNASLEGFIRKSGFEKEQIEQYEMYLPL